MAQVTRRFWSSKKIGYKDIKRSILIRVKKSLKTQKGANREKALKRGIKMLDLTKPLLIINCKNYGETGILGERIAKACKEVLEERRKEQKKVITIALAVPATDVYRIASLGIVPVLCEHLDPEERGATTGHIIAENIKANGGVGSIINHSEDKYPEDELKIAITRAREVGITSIVCAKDSERAKKIAEYEPDCIAVEPPELIGGDISVSSAHPGLIADSVVKVRMIAENTPVLIGAGVKTTEDVAIGMKLGASGILVASGVTKAPNIKKAIEELAEGFN